MGKMVFLVQVQEMYVYICSLICDQYGVEIVDSIIIFYGGSVKFGNVKEFFVNFDVDGGLIGGVFFKVVDFNVIVDSFQVMSSSVFNNFKLKLQWLECLEQESYQVEFIVLGVVLLGVF